MMMHNSRRRLVPFGLLLMLSATACSDEDGSPNDAGSTSAQPDSGPIHDQDPRPDGGPGETKPDGGPGETKPDGGYMATPETYTFKNKYATDEASEGGNVGYSGQVMRHVLIGKLKAEIGDLENNDTSIKTAADVVSRLKAWFDFDINATGAEPLNFKLKGSDETLQTTFSAVNNTPKNLREKLAGNDKGMEEWKADKFRGWVINTSTPTPEALVEHWFNELGDLVISRKDGTNVSGPDRKPIYKWYVSADGLDYQNLIQKFVDGAINFSQAADDYLDDASLEKAVTEPDENTPLVKAGKTLPFTKLEHHWDEGFGYFGASRDYLLYSDDEIAGKGGRASYQNGYHDTDDDGKIDLQSEYIFGHAQNAGKRDRGSQAGAETDFSGDAMKAFLKGRAIISSIKGPFNEAQLADLKAERDKAIQAWEKAIAASMVHYINKVIQDMKKIKTPDYKFEDHAKHWSELKGFSLALQFNPRSPMHAGGGMGLDHLNRTLGMKPVYTEISKDRDDEIKKLNMAKQALGRMYGFDAKNLGDDAGLGGW